MTSLITSDIHLTDSPQDEYRWQLFPWLSQQKADDLIIAGDLTNAKDRHSAVLTNRLFEAVMGLKFRLVVIVMGNHDWYDRDHPFFKFLGNSNTVFVTEPASIELSIGSSLFLPAGLKWDFDLPPVDYIFTHATFTGAEAENGQRLTGVDTAVLKDFKGKVYSGDIHVPQKMLGGKLEYIGAPYHTRFGDSFNPRVVLLADDGRAEDLYFPAPRKLTFSVMTPSDLLKERAERGDYVKIKCLLRRADYVKWRDYKEEIRTICADRGWLLFGAEPVLVGEPSLGAGLEINQDEAAPAPPDERVRRYVSRYKAGERHLEVGLMLAASAGSQ